MASTASNITSKSTVADVRAALAAAGIEAPAKARKAALLDLLHPEQALDAQDPAPAAAEAAPAKAKRTKNVTVEVDGYRVRLSAWVTVHDAEGARMAVLRRSALPSLGEVEATKVMRVMTEYSIAGQPVGWVRNGSKVAAIAKIIDKAAR